MNALIYSDAFWAAVAVGSFLLLAVGVVADLCRKPKRRVM